VLRSGHSRWTTGMVATGGRVKFDQDGGVEQKAMNENAVRLTNEG
jgi:hypothetical protein